jgi:hypothetical protein
MDKSPKRGLLAAYGRLLGPLVRILIRNGVTFDEFSAAAKEIYVDVAASDFSVPNKKPKQTRTAVLAGLSLEQVKQIESAKERARKNGLESNLNRIAIILSSWHTDSDFTGPYGVPLELQIRNKNGGLDFQELVRRHVGDQVDSLLLLTELKNVGAVIETSEGWFKPLTRFYIPKGEAPAGMDHLSRSVEDFVSTLDHNAQEENPALKMFERQTYTAEGIRQEDLPRFKAFATSKAKLLLEEIDNWLSTLEPPTGPEDERTITGLGIYHYVHKSEKKYDS